jgi:hypothetical protein
MVIDYNKSELIPINMDEYETTLLTDILGFEVGNFPIQYLGVPLLYRYTATGRQVLKRMAG